MTVNMRGRQKSQVGWLEVTSLMASQDYKRPLL